MLYIIVRNLMLFFYPVISIFFKDIILLITITSDIYSRNMDIFLMARKTLHVAMISIKEIVIFAQVTLINLTILQSYKNNCFIILAAHVCSKTDPLTGLTKQEFETPYTLSHAIGGWIPVSMRMALICVCCIMSDRNWG